MSENYEPKLVSDYQAAPHHIGDTPAADQPRIECPECSGHGRIAGNLCITCDGKCYIPYSEPTSNQPEKCVHCGIERSWHSSSLWKSMGRCPIYSGGLFLDWHPTNRFTQRRPIAAEKREEEIYVTTIPGRKMQKLMDQISTLQQQLAEAHKENAALQARVTELSNYLTPVEKQLEDRRRSLEQQLAQEKEAREKAETAFEATAKQLKAIANLKGVGNLLRQVELLGIERDQFKSDRANLLEALRTLVARLEAVHNDDRYQSVWQLSQMHFGPYSGLTYTDELAAARAAIQQSEGK